MTARIRPTIGFLTPQDPLSKKTWSGTTSSMYRALQSNCGDVTPLGPAPGGQLGGKLINRALRFMGKRYDYSHGIAYAKRCASFFEKQLQGKNLDLIFAPAASSGLAFLNTAIPVVYASDATFGLLQDYYPEFSNLLPLSIRQGNSIEEAALRKSRLVLFSSEWARRSAIEQYRVSANRVRVVPFGANLEWVPQRELLAKRTPSGGIKLLFLAVDWCRKGGDIALDTLSSLLEKGVDAQLTVCGCTPPPGISHRRMTVIPFLSKENPEQMKIFANLLLASDFLLLPTRYDCTPVVISEANAYGVPVVTTDTGGVSSMIRAGENGAILPFSARGDDYARRIIGLYRDAERYRQLRLSSRAAFDERFNWDAWACEVGNLFSEILEDNEPRMCRRLRRLRGAV